MTCKERLAIDHPDMFDDSGNPLACPSDYGYLPDPGVEHSSYGDCSRMSCVKCWNREIEEIKMTQFDRIKNFTLEEMAEFLLEHANCQCCSRKNFDACHDVGDCKTHVIEYLESEV